MSANIQVQWNSKYTPLTVTGKDCDWAAWTFKMVGRKPTFAFWDTVRDLMLAGFCCLLMVGCGATETVSPEIAERASELASLTSAARDVEAKQDAAIVILQDHSAALLRIENTLEASLAKSEPQTGKDGDPASALEPPAKANDTPSPPKVATPGAFRTASDGTRLQWNIEGNWNPTILETSAHLREDHGIDTNGMTHQEMADIHAALHDGKPVAMKAKPVQYVTRGMNCPNGKCPTATRFVQRRRR